MDNKINFYIVSDSVGDTANQLAEAVAAQFPRLTPRYLRYPFIQTQAKLYEALDAAKENDGIVINTFATGNLGKDATEYAQAHGIACFDVFSPIVDAISEQHQEAPSGVAGSVHDLNDDYFDRISAIEFAVTYDDGKDPKGFLKADIVLLGVSRTSKTPLSLFLANKNLKVANLPLVPKAKIPDEIYEVDPSKIIGLTTDPQVLMEFRRQRMIAYGLNPDTTYSARTQVLEELDFASKLYAKLGCMVINTAHRSIEETATLIMEHMGLDVFDK
ncbi:pyruvate, water dikinase regulatory protein [Lacticaseibacillus songhuajiangensis]|jgi:regulator of PEP synthase PpsR (kinase-PPPase family)|uniref:pyruvate, water dikinase regulatory protein n=1 Tax=Lacticaseibacillus songhuajiangensis TaxID=1296539 RepID=UPI0013DDE0E8|nr:pyruvate, water dikinase regulatory protein [Lacticaseibacillus songhuajiangensis]MCI1283994.1 kinase/pyrophosphorylase [Lacticaseibacillus songhuajiangensis]